jgi:putative ABC transport system permease protein
LTGKLIRRSGYRHLLKNPVQALLSAVGIALGVAVVISIDIANVSAERAFELSMEKVSGKATHKIEAGPEGISVDFYRKLRTESGYENSSPVIEKYVHFSGRDKGAYTLLGLDPFADAPFRTNPVLGNNSIDLGSFMSAGNQILMSELRASKLGIKPGDTLTLEFDGEFAEVVIEGYLPVNNDDAESFEKIIYCDIATAQKIFGMDSSFTRIDLIIENDSELSRIKSHLPAEYRIDRSEARPEAASQMTESFRINLTAMSLLALIVGMFLIYNTMTFSVVQRRRLIGLLRAIGVTKREIFGMITLESLVIGGIGTVAGIFLGIFLGRAMVDLVTGTINDMYYVLEVSGTELQPVSLVKGIILGIAATFVAAWRPASEAADSPPRIALGRSFLERGILEKSGKYARFGLAGIAAGILILLIPTRNIYLSYLGIVPLIAGFALLTPVTIVWSMKLLAPVLKKIFGTVGKMAANGVVHQISRTAVAIAALSISVAAAVGVGTMVKSFRNTVINWLEFRLKADIYVSVPSNVSRFNDGSFPDSIARRIEELEDVRAINKYREFRLNDNGRIIHLLAAKVQSFSYETFKTRGRDNEEIWELFTEKEALMVSEAFAFKNGTEIGDSLEIPVNEGRKKFYVAGIYYDYSSDIGLVMLHIDTYRKYFDDYLLSGVAAFTREGAETDGVIEQINSIAPETNLIVRSNRSLLDTSIEIFDRTFIITNVLQFLAIGVAFIGILSALMALQLERARELGILRANGMTPGQVRKLIIMQTGLMGFVAGLLAIPLGNVLATVLIYIINKRSFGWSLEYHFIPEMFAQAIIIGILAALLAGIYPAIRMSKISPAIALREE